MKTPNHGTGPYFICEMLYKLGPKDAGFLAQSIGMQKKQVQSALNAYLMVPDAKGIYTLTRELHKWFDDKSQQAAKEYQVTALTPPHMRSAYTPEMRGYDARMKQAADQRADAEPIRDIGFLSAWAS